MKSLPNFRDMFELSGVFALMAVIVGAAAVFIFVVYAVYIAFFIGLAKFAVWFWNLLF